MAGIFNRSIFNDAIFNTTPVVAERNAGGWIPPNYRPYRPKLKELPKKVQAVAKRVLKQHIEEPLPEIEEAFVEALERSSQSLKALYLEVLRREVMRIRELEAQEDEEETLLFM
jgi:hypothetical protein